MEKEQKKYDEKKWFDSIKYEKDMCGSYTYCCVCKKTEESPCVKANNRYNKMSKTRREKAKAKYNFEGKEVNFRATIFEK